MHLASILSVKKRQKCNKEGGMGRENFISYRSHNSKQKDEQRCLGYRSFKGNIIKKNMTRETQSGNVHSTQGIVR